MGIVTTWPFNPATFLRPLPAFFRFQQNSTTPSSSFFSSTYMFTFFHLSQTHLLNILSYPFAFKFNQILWKCYHFHQIKREATLSTRSPFVHLYILVHSLSTLFHLLDSLLHAFLHSSYLCARKRDGLFHLAWLSVQCLEIVVEKHYCLCIACSSMHVWFQDEKEYSLG